MGNTASQLQGDLDDDAAGSRPSSPSTHFPASSSPRVGGGDRSGRGQRGLGQEVGKASSSSRHRTHSSVSSTHKYDGVYRSEAVLDSRSPPVPSHIRNLSASHTHSSSSSDGASRDETGPVATLSAKRAQGNFGHLMSSPNRKPSAKAFDPRLVVSPCPSPSLATHHAAGVPSHTTTQSADQTATSDAIDVPQDLDSVTPRSQDFASSGGISMDSSFSNLADNRSSLTADSAMSRADPLGRRLPAALPSYLKIPTAIPSTFASPAGSNTASPSPSPSPHPQAHSPTEEFIVRPAGDASVDDSTASASASGTSSWSAEEAHAAPGLVGSGPTAALNLEDVVIGPGYASKISSPMVERSSLVDGGDVTDAGSGQPDGLYGDHVTTPTLADIQNNDDLTDQPQSAPIVAPPRASSSSSEASTVYSRTPTPTPGDKSARALTPTGSQHQLRSLSLANHEPSASSGSASSEHGATGRLQVVSGTESGYNTPALPPGLISAPPSANAPMITPTPIQAQSSGIEPIDATSLATLDWAPPQQSRREDRISDSASTTPRSGSTSRPPKAERLLSGPAPRVAGAPLMPIVLTWRGGGREIFATGTFANEWRSKILLKPTNPSGAGAGGRASAGGSSARREREHSCILHLPPGTHRLKFIVDDRWRVSRHLATASDGDGNLVNYVEIPNVGPAHTGPLSAPGEDLLDNDDKKSAADPSDRGSKKAHSEKVKHALDAHRSTMNLIEEARRAEALRRGELEEVFGETKALEHQWTREIPASVVAASEAEADEIADGASSPTSRHLPRPPAVPRQLEKVILNSSPINPAVNGGNTVDDNSILPAPNHVVLNHLTTRAIKGGVLAVGTTTRYKRKYVTTVFYRPVQS